MEFCKRKRTDWTLSLATENSQNCIYTFGFFTRYQRRQPTEKKTYSSIRVFSLSHVHNFFSSRLLLRQFACTRKRSTKLTWEKSWEIARLNNEAVPEKFFKGCFFEEEVKIIWTELFGVSLKVCLGSGVVMTSIKKRVWRALFLKFECLMRIKKFWRYFEVMKGKKRENQRSKVKYLFVLWVLWVFWEVFVVGRWNNWIFWGLSVDGDFIFQIKI